MKTTATFACYSFHTLRGFVSCYNKHSNVTVDGAAGGSSHCFLRQSVCEWVDVQRDAVLYCATGWHCVVESHAACLIHIPGCIFSVSVILTVSLN